MVTKPKSIRSEGLTSVGIDVKTRHLLRELAGDYMPLGHYLRELALREAQQRGIIEGDNTNNGEGVHEHPRTTCDLKEAVNRFFHIIGVPQKYADNVNKRFPQRDHQAELEADIQLISNALNGLLTRLEQAGKAGAEVTE